MSYRSLATDSGTQPAPYAALKELLKKFLVCMTYLIVSINLVLYLWYLLLKAGGIKVALTYYCLCFPCHANDLPRYHYSDFESFFVPWGSFLVSFILMLIGIVILSSTIRKKEYVAYSGIILINVPLFSSIILILSRIMLFFTNRNFFNKIWHETLGDTKAVWAIIIVSSVITLWWTIKKFYRPLNMKQYFVIAPFAIALYYVGWFYFLGPWIFGRY